MAVALTGGAVGCTSGTGTSEQHSGASNNSRDGGARAATCANGTFTWFNVERPDRLLGVSEPEEMSKGGGRLTHKVRRVGTVQTAVRAEGAVPASEEVLFSLGKKIGEIDSSAATLKDVTDQKWRFTEVGDQGPRLNDDGPAKVHGPGRFVQYSAVRAVEADFRYTCPAGSTTAGHAKSWTVPMEGLVECGTRTDKAIARQAARRACGAGSAAAKA
ncbi:hypothetical protein ACIOC2_26650 [Streptomyces sp. NPDC088337]|uniref:hypothetical protein n=1 Tax=unclassified Streptomyces TaxID=2593676 RepID=UPI00381DC882